MHVLECILKMTKRKHPKISLNHDVLLTTGTHSQGGCECPALSGDEGSGLSNKGCNVFLLPKHASCVLTVLPENEGSDSRLEKLPVLQSGAGCGIGIEGCDRAFPVLQPKACCESSANQSEAGCEDQASQTGCELPGNQCSGLNCDGAADMDVSGNGNFISSKKVPLLAT